MRRKDGSEEKAHRRIFSNAGNRGYLKKDEDMPKVNGAWSISKGLFRDYGFGG